MQSAKVSPTGRNASHGPNEKKREEVTLTQTAPTPREEKALGRLGQSASGGAGRQSGKRFWKVQAFRFRLAPLKHMPCLQFRFGLWHGSVQFAHGLGSPRFGYRQIEEMLGI